MLAHILGGGTGLSSRLFREVREKRGLAYTAYAGLSTLDHASYLTGGTTTKNERARESLDVIRGEILDMAENAVSEEELEKGKRYLIGSYPLASTPRRRSPASSCRCSSTATARMAGRAQRSDPPGDAVGRQTGGAGDVRRREPKRGDGGAAGGEGRLRPKIVPPLSRG